jgi:hypothetical protein
MGSNLGSSKKIWNGKKNTSIKNNSPKKALAQNKIKNKTQKNRKEAFRVMTDKNYKLESEEYASNLYKNIIDPSIITKLREKGWNKIRGDQIHFLHYELGEVFIDDETVPASDRQIKISVDSDEVGINNIKSCLEKELEIKLLEID